MYKLKTFEEFTSEQQIIGEDFYKKYTSLDTLNESNVYYNNITSVQD